MHWLFLILFIDSGSGAFGEHALWQSEPDQVVRARLRLRLADSLRVGSVFPGEVGRYTGILSRRIRLGERKVVMSDVAGFERLLRRPGGLVCTARIMDRNAARINVARHLFDHIAAFGEKFEIGVLVEDRGISLLLVVELGLAGASVLEVGFREEVGHEA